MITAEIYKQATGRDPENDDLERANCPHAGYPGHYACGWSHKHNAPFTQVPRTIFYEYGKDKPAELP